jgi:hypothetical protein
MSKTMQHNIPQLCFLSRDGKIMLHAYQQLQQRFPSPTRCHYLNASRRALNFAAIFRLQEKDLDFLTSTTRPTSLGNMLMRAGLPPGQQAAVAAMLGIADPAAPLSQRQTLAMKRAFSTLSHTIEAKAAEERAAYIRYLQHTLCFRPGTTIALIDIGWHGSLQASLRLLLDHAGAKDTRLHGFYLGLHPAAADVPQSAGDRYGYFTQFGQPADRHDTLMLGVEVLEFLFSADEPGFVCMQLDHNGCPIPQFLHHPSQPDCAAATAILHLQAMRFVTDFSERCEDPLPWLPPAMVHPLLHRLLAHPRKDEADAIGDTAFATGFGHCDHSLPIAARTADYQPLLHPQRLLADFKSSLWRHAFVVRLTPAQRFILSLLSPAARNICRQMRPFANNT